MDDDGKVVVDQEERTSAQNVYAIGDVARVLLCTYKFIYLGLRTCRNANVHSLWFK